MGWSPGGSRSWPGCCWARPAAGSAPSPGPSTPTAGSPEGWRRPPALNHGGIIMDLQPGGLLVWLIVGLIAGWAAGQFMKGSGFGLIGDIIVGIIGAFIGGALFGFLMPGAAVGLLGSIVVAFVGAVILIALLRAVSGRRGSSGRGFGWR